MRKYIAAVGIAVGVFALSSCASATEGFNDAPIKRKVDDGAAVFSMPDGFANYAEKCDDSGHLVLTTRDGTGGGKAVAIILDRAACPRAGAPVKLSGQ